MSHQVLNAFLLTLFAGLSTGIGSAIAFFSKSTNKKFLSAALGFSAGVMIFISFVEMYPMAKTMIAKSFSPKKAEMITIVVFVGGMILSALIDLVVPEAENPHEARNLPGEAGSEDEKRALMRLGLLSAVAIAIHNFPEGIATFAAAYSSPTLGVSIAVAVAIHNIPEGIAVSVPIYYATGSKKKAFWYSFMSGLAEPLGAIVAFFTLRAFFSDLVMGYLFAAVAGIMVFISLDELIPTAKKYGEGHWSVYGLISGIIVIAFSLVVLD
ncbi:zinc transporter ZupT [Myxococcota bacterium]|nr:zinc transporter ZupT [Myxococcota bacterium]MBU1381275.1 zinc transporter ZupT [Myxococcota bacterium]MBU1495987.1 zinc transporter ZupT [Myxococcota bacterium]